MERETNNQVGRNDDPDQSYPTACESMPDFTRLRYFHGQMLGHHDFQNEQNYFREKLKLLNRCLHGYGTVCGLKVVLIEDDPDCYSPEYHDAEQSSPQPHDKPGPAYAKQKEKAGQQEPGQQEVLPPPVCVEIECGFALDCEGNELVVRHPLRFDLWRELNEAERREILQSGSDRIHRLYLSICFCVQPIDPVRPVLPDACNAVSECVYSKLRDSVKVRVTTEIPKSDHCRDNCCEKCRDKCLLLAAVDLKKGAPPVIYNDVRRWITVYEPVTITGVSWAHGADSYTPEDGVRLLQDEGLTIEFSRPIITETVTRGVIDVIVFEGGKGRHSGMYYVDGNITMPDDRHIVFKDLSEEMLEHGDRVAIIVRTDFILDKCCRPVDGNHVGGRVPLLWEFRHNEPKNAAEIERICSRPPRRYGAWISGNGTAGGSFESWFYIQRAPRRQSEVTKPESKNAEAE